MTANPPVHGPRRVWRTGVFLSLFFGAVLCKAFSAYATEILDFAVNDQGLAQATYESEVNFYYVLVRGDQVMDVSTPKAMDLGENSGVGTLIDPEPVDMRQAAFYVIRKIPLSDPLDLDGDGIDDRYELLRRPDFDPLNFADAVFDFDLDGIRNLEEFRAGSDPFVVERLSPPAPTVTTEKVATRDASVRITGSAEPLADLVVEGGSERVTGFAKEEDGSFSLTIPLRPNRLNRLFVTAVDSNRTTSVVSRK